MSEPTTGAALQVLVEREKCCGYGNCVLAAPEVFGLSDDDGIVVVLDEHPAPGLREKVAQAVGDCPTEALGLRD